MRWPDFFIVGAPKCGTTALYAYLKQHPQIFLPDHKEPHHFGSDLDFQDQRPPDEAEYAALFAGARDDQKVGEASVFYLLSQRAAEEIHARRPDARILVMLREPVEMLYSFHAQRVFNGTEDLDFLSALEQEPARRRGERLPSRVGLRQGLYYGELVSFADQLGRYLDTFGPEQVKVILYDDFREDPGKAVAEACEFIGVDAWVPDALPVVNANKEARSHLVRSLLWKRPAFLRPFRWVVPLAWRKQAARKVKRWNTRATERAPLEPADRAALQARFAPEVERLAALIGRDLSAWLPE